MSYSHGGPRSRASGVLDPGGRIRTGTSALDRRVLYLLSYPGAVPRV